MCTERRGAGPPSASLRSCWADDPVLGSEPAPGTGTPRKQIQAAPRGLGAVAGCVSDATASLPPPQEHRGLLAIRYPMEHGVVRDWNDMERIWQYVYSKDQLQTFSEEVWQPGPVRVVPSPCPAVSLSGFHVPSGFRQGPLPLRALSLFVVWMWVHMVSGCQAECSRETWIFRRVTAGR